MGVVARAAALALVAAPAAAGSVALPLACHGTEPFWSLRIGSDTARFERAGEAATDYAVETVAPAEARRGPPFLATLAGGRPAYALLQERGCSDGMSDRTHPWSLSLILPAAEGAATLLDGCCRPADAP